MWWHRFKLTRLLRSRHKLFKLKEASKQEESSEGNQNLDLKEIAGVEPIAEHKNGQQGEETVNKDEESAILPADDQQQESETRQQEADAGKVYQEVNGTPPQNTPLTATETPAVETHHQFNGNKRNNNQHLPGHDQRGVFIQGYDYQVAKVCNTHNLSL